MKRLLLLCLVTLTLFPVLAQENPLWMRYSAISPDGSTIAFAYKGDVYTVPAGGGRATQLTTNAAFDSYPVWSPDSKQIAFASDRMGSLDVFIISREGGIPKRLTTFSGKEVPVAFKDENTVLFSADIMPSTEDVHFPARPFYQMYEVNVNGGRPLMFASMPMENISVHKDGKKILFHDVKGYEDYWRKHHTSSVTRDVWLYNPEGEIYEKLTTFKGENRNPVWAPDGNSFYYLSEEKGSFNVFRKELGAGSATRITQHDIHPVRFLTIADNGTLCYGYDGEIYTLAPGKAPQKLNVSILADTNDKNLIREIKTGGAREIAVSPDSKEIAFILNGDVYVTSAEYKTTRQITNTPEQERNLSFSPDGRSLLYSSERNGLWQVYQSSIVRKEDKLFTYATEVREERLTDSDKVSFQAAYSPDGKEIAFLEDRTTVRVMNLKSREVRTVMDGKYDYSYSDGDQWFQWSPDSRWILSQTIGEGGWHNKDVALIKADGKGEMYNLTQSGYTDGRPKWVLDGKAMIWRSDRAGYRSHGSWGAEADTYIMFFDLEAYDRFRMNKEELALLEEAEKEAEKEKEKNKKKDKKEGDADKEKKKEVEPLEFDLENCRDRVIRLTVNSSRMADAVLTPKGDKLYYLASFEKGYDLWVHDLKANETKVVLKNTGVGALLPDKEGKNIFVSTNSGIKKIEVEGAKSTPVEFEAFYDLQPYEQRRYIFEHAWKQVLDKFYVTNLHGVDWPKYRTEYEKYLPHINNNYDFAEMLGELLGELDASHTGGRYSAPAPKLTTASLGIFYDDTYQGEGLKVKEILAQGPFAVKKNQVKAGDVILAIDGVKIGKSEDFFPLLEGKNGRKVTVTVLDPVTGRRFEEEVKAISYSAQAELLYKRWVENRRKKVEELSGGRLGYVHVKGMNSDSYRSVYSDLLGRDRNKEAAIVDTRFNGGGWLHDDLATLLGGKEYLRFTPRGQYIGSEPFNKWLKPSCVLISEGNYSDAHGFPWVYKHLQVGKLVGAPVPGTMTAVWWETQIDPTLVFGIPQVAVQDLEGNYMENMQLEPDVLIYNNPGDMLKGEDAQLKAGVETLLKELDNK